MSKQLKYDFLLLLVALGWGFSFYLIDITMKYMGPFMLNAYRFIIAFLVIGAFSFNKLKNPSRQTLKYSLIVGIVFFIAYGLSNIGIMFTSLSNASFLPGLSVVFTPVLSALIYKNKPERKFILVVLMSIIGTGLLTLREGFDINSDYFFGDFASILTAFFSALAIVLTGGAVLKEEVDSYQLGVYQLGVVGVLSLIFALAFEMPAMPSLPHIWITVLFLALFCTGFALVIQPVALKYTTDGHVAIILAMEPLFAGFVAYFIAGEVLSKRSYLGAALMIISIFIMEIDFKGLKERIHKNRLGETHCTGEKE
mgnify:FL=1